jgi:hypothetical protein
MESFMTIRNHQMCETYLRSFMCERHGVQLPADDMRPRRLLLRIMRDVRAKYMADYPDIDLKTLNNVSLNMAVDVCLEQQQRQQQQKQQQQHQQQLMQGGEGSSAAAPLERDQRLYGDRPSTMIVEGLMPHHQPPIADAKRGIQCNFDTALMERGMVVDGTGVGLAPVGNGAPRLLPPLASERPLHEDEFARRIANMDMQRTQIDRDTRPPPPQPANQPSQSMQTALSALPPVPPQPPQPHHHFPPPQADGGVGGGGGGGVSMAVSDEPPLPVHPSDAAQAVPQHAPTFTDHGTPLPPPASGASVAGAGAPATSKAQAQAVGGFWGATPPTRILLDHYLSIYGFDRNWDTTDPLRYSFTVRVAGYTSSSMQGTHRNIHSMQVTRVTLPMEIVQASGGPTPVAVKPVLHNDVSFSYPNVTLCIDDMGDVYDGTNDAARRAFCQLVFQRSYKAHNGRGYLILEPMQDEKKVFHPTPLSALRNLTLSLRRPNGLLFTNAADDYNVQQVLYETFNRQLIKVVLDKYFDRNEFHQGDSVLFRGFVAGPLLPPSSGSPAVSEHTLAALNTFVNRPEGHTVVQLAAPNDDGFYRAFYVYAPGVLDQRLGRIMLDDAMITAIGQLASPSVPCGSPVPPTCGAVINTSLQMHVAMTLQAYAPDPNHTSALTAQSIY